MEKTKTNLPIEEKMAIDLFKVKTTRRSRGKKEIDLSIMKLRRPYMLNSFDFYWVQTINDRPQLDIALKVLSGKTDEEGNICDGDFFSFEEKDVLQMKRTEVIADRIYLLNSTTDLKFLKVATEEEAKKALDAKNVYIALLRVKNGKFAFPVWIDADVTQGYKTVSFWGRLQTMKEVDFVTPVNVGDKLYRKTFTVCKNDFGLYLKT